MLPVAAFGFAVTSGGIDDLLSILPCLLPYPTPNDNKFDTTYDCVHFKQENTSTDVFWSTVTYTYLYFLVLYLLSL